MPVNASGEWRIDEGVLAHRTGGFFSIRGIHVSAPGSKFDERRFPMIDQPEVGLLGFVVATGGDETLWLLQAKSEPGSVHWVQAAPTVQATRSNFTRRHGGARTRFLDRFPFDEDGSPAGNLNSEQGNRFLSKFNCNATVTVQETFDPEDPDWAWFGAQELRRALAQDFTVNTDARSVIATGDWRLLRRNGRLFDGASWAGPDLVPFRQELARCYSENPADKGRGEALLGVLGGAGSPSIRLTGVPLDSLPGWRLEPEGLRRQDEPGFAGGVQMFAVEAPRREVKAWDQPFMMPVREERACLVLARLAGQLRVALRPVAEPGFMGRREFGPTYQSDGDVAEEVREVVEDPSLTSLLSVRQSDEGGRFMRSIMRYDVLFVDERGAAQLGKHVTWVSVGELEWLCRSAAATTNEARSVVSVLLSLA